VFAVVVIVFNPVARGELKNWLSDLWIEKDRLITQELAKRPETESAF